ncbi:hypothetical protein EVAR_88258_1 [Eumeta japonica]|uniref:Uncharacterized protein n=1 Tax=Eumeta variegata TaxID=151549 RepID=A0A4C1XK47_EUMVA|nr:hypothetical protein EVAR_88258_1 [Eumeta japonica]
MTRPRLGLGRSISAPAPKLLACAGFRAGGRRGRSGRMKVSLRFDKAEVAAVGSLTHNAFCPPNVRVLLPGRHPLSLIAWELLIVTESDTRVEKTDTKMNISEMKIKAKEKPLRRLECRKSGAGVGIGVMAARSMTSMIEIKMNCVYMFEHVIQKSAVLTAVGSPINDGSRSVPPSRLAAQVDGRSGGSCYPSEQSRAEYVAPSASIAPAAPSQSRLI